MITVIDSQNWSPEITNGNSQFLEVGSTIYVVSQVRADNTFAIFKSGAVPPQPGPGNTFTSVATYTFPTVNGNHNSSFDPVVSYDSSTQILYIVGTQDNPDGGGVDVLLFSFNTGTNTLSSPVTLVTASYVRDSYDVCALAASQFVAVSFTNPQQIWSTQTTTEVTNISITSDVIKVYVSSVPFSVGQKITFTGLQNADSLNGVTVTLASTGSDSGGDFFTADYTAEDYTQEGFESGFATWLPGHTLLGFEMNGTSLVGTTVLATSPFSSGDAFGAISICTPSGSDIEVYYESHPKKMTAGNQSFSLNQITRVSSVWSAPSSLFTFTGKYTDDRLTVTQNGTSRVVLQQYYSQMSRQNTLLGNLLLGYYNGTTWNFHPILGSPALSYIQSVLSTTSTEAYISYLAEPAYNLKGRWAPEVKAYITKDRVTYNGVDYVLLQNVQYNFIGTWSSSVSYVKGSVVTFTAPHLAPAYYTAKNSIQASLTAIAPNLDVANWTSTLTPDADIRFTPAPTSWPLHTNSFDLGTFTLKDIPGFWNTQNFTWLRGSKSTLDSGSGWAVVGERWTPTGAVASYFSGFEVPPVAQFTPTGTVTLYRGTPLLLDASGTYDATDSVNFSWSDNSINSNVTLSPIISKATLTVNRAVGGSALEIIAGVVAVDASSPSHYPPMQVTNVAVTSDELTVTTAAPVSLAAGQSVFLYDLTTATFLNNQVVTVLADASGDSFTASYTHTDCNIPDTGKAITAPQYARCTINVPFNAEPTIDFTRGGSVTLPIAAARNSQVVINPLYTGVTDPDDLTTYSWVQLSGTPVPDNQIVSTTEPLLVFTTNGSNVSGDTLVWQLTVDDGVNPPQVDTVTVDVAPFSSSIVSDTKRLSRSVWGANISYRNSVQSWSALDMTSALYTNLKNVKRFSVTDGTDRYLLISPASVTLYGGIDTTPTAIRRLFVPGNIPIVDATHTELDYTFVLDSSNNLYRYTQAPLINTDAPDTTLNLSSVSGMSFNQVLSTVSHNNIRVLALSGSDGCLLLQINESTMAVQGAIELTVATGLVYGADNVVWVRTANVEALNSGKVLLGTVESTGGKTYETLIDLSQGRIIGTWDASKLKNQFVTTGEVLFEPDNDN